MFPAPQSLILFLDFLDKSYKKKLSGSFRQFRCCFWKNRFTCDSLSGVTFRTGVIRRLTFVFLFDFMGVGNSDLFSNRHRSVRLYILLTHSRRAVICQRRVEELCLMPLSSNDPLRSGWMNYGALNTSFILTVSCFIHKNCCAFLVDDNVTILVSLYVCYNDDRDHFFVYAARCRNKDNWLLLYMLLDKRLNS